MEIKINLHLFYNLKKKKLRMDMKYKFVVEEVAEEKKYLLDNWKKDVFLLNWFLLM